MKTDGNRFVETAGFGPETPGMRFFEQPERFRRNFLAYPVEKMKLAGYLKDKLYNSDNRLRFINIPAEFFKRPKGQFYGDKK